LEDPLLSSFEPHPRDTDKQVKWTKMSDGTENESDDQRRHQREVSFKKEQSLKYVAGDEEEELEEIQSTGCGILGRFPVLSVLIFAAGT